MIKTKTIIIWSSVGILFAGVLFYLMDIWIHAYYDNGPTVYDQSEEYKVSTACFISGVIQLLIGFFLIQPARKTYHVPAGKKEYRDPFVGLDREEFSDHGYGMKNSKGNNKRLIQGFIFAMPGLTLVLYSLYISS